jgi:hypothetical protein
MRSHLLPMVILLGACKSEYDVNSIEDGVDDPEDTDTGGDTDVEPDDEPAPEPCDYVLDQLGEYTFDWDGSVTSWCQAVNDPVIDSFVRPHDFYVGTFQIVGNGNIEESGVDTEYDVRLTQVQWNSSGWSYTDSLHSDSVQASQVGAGDWTASGGTTGEEAVCTPDCDYSFVVEIRDEYTAADNECAVRYPPDVEVCVDWFNASSRRRVQSDTSCSDGSGRFRLVPAWARNRDLDGNKSVVWRPIMISGTGTMTAAAWITSATPVVDQGLDLRIIKSGQDFAFDTNDQLLDPVAMSVLLPGNGASFQPGVLGGLAPFVITEAPSSTSADLQVDLSWTCAAAGQDAVTPPQGYVFYLPDIGCNLPIPQKFVIRPVTSDPTARDHMTVEYYGLDADRVYLPLTASQAGGYRFRIDRHGLEVKGRLVSASVQNGAVLDIDSVSITGTSMCTPGTYTIPAL